MFFHYIMGKTLTLYQKTQRQKMGARRGTKFFKHYLYFLLKKKAFKKYNLAKFQQEKLTQERRL